MGSEAIIWRKLHDPLNNNKIDESLFSITVRKDRTRTELNESRVEWDDEWSVKEGRRWLQLTTINIWQREKRYIEIIEFQLLNDHKQNANGWKKKENHEENWRQSLSRGKRDFQCSFFTFFPTFTRHLVKNGRRKKGDTFQIAS